MKKVLPLLGALLVLVVPACKAPARYSPAQTGTASVPAAVADSHTPADIAAVTALTEILTSKNDNDARLDTAFNSLSPAAKTLFRDKYRTLAPEDRNGRGTIVYLLGKNLKDETDWAFLREVVSEPPCLSLADCAVPAEMTEEHNETGMAVTLAYPALVALKQAENTITDTKASTDSFAVTQAWTVIDAAKLSKSGKTAAAAARLQTLLK